MKAIVSLAIGLIIWSATAGQDAPPSSTKKAYVRTGLEGTINGTVRFKGKRPKILYIDMQADPICVEINPNPVKENAVITGGKLANVFIYVKDNQALNDYSFEVPVWPVLLEHKGCRYIPHVLGIQTGQTLQVINGDQTAHNTHALPRPEGNSEWSVSQRVGGAVVERKFDKPELFIPFKDNQHPWEKAYVNVLAHPFFAVTSKDGSYKIEGLPPGDYTVVAQHETFGELKMKVTIVPYEVRSLDLLFDCSE